MKKAASVLAALLLIFALCSCSMSAKDASSQNGYGGSSGTATAPSAPPSADGYYGEMDMAVNKDTPMEFGLTSRPGGGYENVAEAAPSVGTGFAEKIIYSASADIETIDFDATIDRVHEMLEMYGAFIENSYISGNSHAQTYYGYQSYRSAQFTLRVPVSAYDLVTNNLGALGNVTSLRSSADNITAQFFDTESRLTTYKTEESRLLDMLSKAETVADMIIIEERLSNVRYQIESLTSTLKNWQNQVDYSTVTLYINEVAKLTESAPIQRSYWGQIGEGIKSTLGGIGEFGKGSLKWLIIASPVLLILAVAGVVTLIVLKKKKHTKVELPKGDE